MIVEMFDFTPFYPPVWPDRFKPKGEGTGEKEQFDAWWSRHGSELANLHPKIAEQWVYRHWFLSDFAFLPLDSMSWELQQMEGAAILAFVRRELARQLNPKFDYEAFQGRHGREPLPTAKDLDQGTWDYPIILLSTPSGWLSREGEFPDVRLVLVEGHQRHRYLNALHALGMPPRGPHEVFVISSPLVG